MEKYFKVSLLGFVVYVVCTLISYLVASLNPIFASSIMIGGAIALGIATGALLLGLVDGIFAQHKDRVPSAIDELSDCYDFNDVVADLDIEANRVNRVCDALEKIASVEGAGSFDACDIMACAVDFRERAAELHYRADVLAEARRNRKFDGIKELTVNYSSEPMFKGLRDTIQSHLPESFNKPMYLDVDERLCEIYNKLSSLCDEQR